MDDGSGGSIIGTLIYLALVILVIVATWKVFEKAGQPGWACLIPFYNIYIFLVIAGKPAWWLVLLLIPVVNIIFAVIACIAFAKKFGKDALFGVGLVLLGIVFFPILAWGDATYSA
ncbi:MAG: signal peptidase I [Proteobacteria bacterium]|nr:signal peptidase I [Pseudomonadota bacterium]MBU1638863.1 signal peptidase I [Pseudomonadota bacterium]